MIRTFSALSALLLFAPVGPAGADDDLATHNRLIVAGNPQAATVFAVEKDGSIRHLLSGADCPAEFPNVHLTDVQIYPSTAIGTDVGCDYARGDGQGGAVSKLTIFLVKPPAGANLESIFAGYQQEIRRVHPGAAEMPPSLHITDGSTGKDNGEYRAVGYSVLIDQKKYHSELIVGLFKEWVLEVRATYPSEIIYVDNKTSDGDIANQLYDIKSPYLSFMTVRDSIGGVISGRR